MTFKNAFILSSFCEPSRNSFLNSWKVVLLSHLRSSSLVYWPEMGHFSSCLLNWFKDWLTLFISINELLSEVIIVFKSRPVILTFLLVGECWLSSDATCSNNDHDLEYFFNLLKFWIVLTKQLSLDNSWTVQIEYNLNSIFMPLATGQQPQSSNHYVSYLLHL